MAYIFIYCDKSIKWTDDEPTLVDLMAVKQELLIIIRIISSRNLQIINKELIWHEVKYVDLSYVFGSGFVHI